MLDNLKLMMANQYFERQMKKVFVDRVNYLGIESFEEYLSYRYRDNCYYYSGYAIMGLNNDDCLMRGGLCISGDFIWGRGGYQHGWVEFKFLGKIYVFDSMCRGVVPKEEWYNAFKPKIEFNHSKKEIVESIMVNAKKLKRNCYEVQKVEMQNDGYYTQSVYRRGKLFMQGDRVKKFIAYDEPSG